jgi:hypothetical protein
MYVYVDMYKGYYKATFTTLGAFSHAQEGLALSSCRSLRKIVDRQSRWRPRELQFEQMEAPRGSSKRRGGEDVFFRKLGSFRDISGKRS